MHRLHFLLILCCGFISISHAADYYWKPSHSGKFTDLDNWVLGSLDSDERPEALPQTGDSIFITQSGSYEVIYDLPSEKSSVYEQIIIGTPSSASFHTAPLPQAPSQYFTLHEPISVNSKIHVNDNGVFRVDGSKVTVSGGATLEAEKGGKIEHFSGRITTIGDITVAGEYELHSGEISGSGQHALVITPEGHFKTLSPEKATVHRPVHVSGLFEHAAPGAIEFTQEVIIEPDAHWTIAGSGAVHAKHITMKGEWTVSSETHIKAHLQVEGKVVLDKPLHVHDTLDMRDGSHMSIRQTALIVHKVCNIVGGTVEGYTQTQDNRIELHGEGSALKIDHPGAITGNMRLHIHSGTQLINWSGKNDFNGSIHVHGILRWISGSFKLSGSLIVYEDGHLFTENPDDDHEPSKELTIHGEVRIHGKYTHTHTSNVLFHSALIVERNAEMLWAGAGELQGDGMLQNKGRINVGSSSCLSISEVRNEGEIHVHSAKFTLASEHFLQEAKEAVITLNGARFVVDSHMKLFGGELKVSGSDQSFVVVAPKGHVEQHVKLHGAVSLSIHGEYTTTEDVCISRNIDVFPNAQFTVKQGNVVGDGQLLVHKDGLMQIEESAECNLQKVVLIAGQLHIEGCVAAHSDITVLESTGLVHLTKSAVLRGKGHLTNHGELRIDTSSQCKIELTINNSGRALFRSNTHLTKPFQQIDSSAETILDHAKLDADQEFVLGDGTFFGVGTIKTPQFSCAGDYGAYVDDKVGVLRVDGNFLSPGTATAHFKVRSAQEHSIVEVSKEMHVDGSVLRIELIEGYNPGDSTLELIRSKQLKGDFTRVEVLGGDQDPELKYHRSKGKVVLKLSREDSGARSIGGSWVWSALVLFVSVVVMI